MRNGRMRTHKDSPFLMRREAFTPRSLLAKIRSHCSCAHWSLPVQKEVENECTCRKLMLKNA